MSNNCSQIKEKFKQLLNLKQEFEQVFISKDLKFLEQLMRNLKSRLEDLEETVGIRLAAVVDYSRSVEEMINAGGYNWTDRKNINSKNFPPENKPESKVRFELVNFQEVTFIEHILAELEKRGLRPATLQELMAFGEKYPDKQREGYIVSLDFSWRGETMSDRVLPCLYGNRSKRKLGLPALNVWTPNCKVLAVHK